MTEEANWVIIQGSKRAMKVTYRGLDPDQIFHSTRISACGVQSWGYETPRSRILGCWRRGEVVKLCSVCRNPGKG